MEIVNPNAAGIDIGSRSHFVAVGQGSDDVREFGVYNDDLKAIGAWLKVENVKTVAMESTGTYWQSLYAVLQAEGFQVILCNGKFTKNIKGRKSDVQNYTASVYSPEVFFPMQLRNSYALIAGTALICWNKQPTPLVKCRSICGC